MATGCLWTENSGMVENYICCFHVHHLHLKLQRFLAVTIK